MSCILCHATQKHRPECVYEGDVPQPTALHPGQMITHPALLSDGGWRFDDASSAPSRGLRDFYRVLVFARELAHEERLALARTMKDDPRCPGWTGVTMGLDERTSQPGAHVYTARTTWDSSD